MLNKPESTYAFRTKAGTCEIGKDAIHLHRHGIRVALASLVAKLYAGMGMHRSDNKIPLTNIKRVEGTPANPYVSRAFFTIHYLRDGRMHQRLIILPGTWGGGAEEYDIAINAFSNSGIKVDAG